MKENNNFELQNEEKLFLIEHWITSSVYKILDEIFLKITVPVSRFLLQYHLEYLGSRLKLTEYIDLNTAVFNYLGGNLKNVSNFKGILLNFNDFSPK